MIGFARECLPVAAVCAGIVFLAGERGCMGGIMLPSPDGRYLAKVESRYNQLIPFRPGYYRITLFEQTTNGWKIVRKCRLYQPIVYHARGESDEFAVWSNHVFQVAPPGVKLFFDVDEPLFDRRVVPWTINSDGVEVPWDPDSDLKQER
jgi:hypothetical protein